MRLMNKLLQQVIVLIGFSWLPCMASFCDRDHMEYKPPQPKSYRHIDDKDIISHQLHNYFYSSNRIYQSLSKTDGAAKLLHDLNRFDNECRPQIFALIHKVYDELEAHDFYTHYNYALIQIRGQNIVLAEHVYKNLITYDNLTQNQISKRQELEIILNFLQGNHDKVANLIKELETTYVRSKAHTTHIIKMALQYKRIDDINPEQQFTVGTERSIIVDNLITNHRSFVVKFNNGSIINFKTGAYTHFIDNNFESFYIKNFCEVAKEFFLNPNLWSNDQEIKSRVADANNLAHMCQQYMYYSSNESERLQAKTILKVLTLSGISQATTIYFNFLANNQPRVHWHQNEQPAAQQSMKNRSANLR